MTCSTCDGYQLVPGIDGFLIRCDDCLQDDGVRCPVHGSKVAANGKCRSCGREASLAQDLLEQTRKPSVFA